MLFFKHPKILPTLNLSINYNPIEQVTNFNFLVVFFFSKKLPIVVVRDVCPSVRLSSVEIISFRGNSLSNRPINLKIGLNVREGVVHVRKV